MKTYLLFFCLICSNGLGFSQNQASDFSGNKSDLPRDPRADQMNFVPNEVIVKFKDAVPMQVGTRLKVAGVSSVDMVLQSHGITSLEMLFPTEQKPQRARIMKSPQGNDMKIPALDKIYRISVPPAQATDSMPTNIFQIIEELKALPEVEYAEPNYIYSIGDFSPAGPEMTSDDLSKQESNKQKVGSDSGVVPNDPLYSQQWGIPATNIDKVWNTTTGDSTAIIAILDTGVDWQHPDLAANIWTNTQEIPDNGIDDDVNGLIDDIRGWDYINNDNNPTDDNSHGTHCAGIAAAVGNNGIGIAGVNWHAKIMPIKVFQSSGRGDAATIAKGVNYAVRRGATVINMSFGSYSESLALKDALANAYATVVLVAAAGNDATPIGPCPGCAPMYPGAYSFVLGVEANKQVPEACVFGAPPIIRACFSNYDQDGPVFSKYSDLLNYELKAPGSGIVSCVPGGNYREFNGTSMAAPLVAGAVSLYWKLKSAESQEMLFGNLINSLGQHLDLDAALNIIPVPKLDIVSYVSTDTLDGDRDGRPDAGETIELKVKVRNSWTLVNDVKVGIEFGEFEDQATATILTSEVVVGSVSAYATRENTISLKIKLAVNINDGRDIIFKLKTWFGDHLGETSQPITINIENGIELKGVISKDMTLYPNKQYIITDNLAIAEGATLLIKPGTTLKFAENKSLVIAGNVIANGSPDSLITFTKRDLFSSWRSIKIGGNGSLKIEYCKISYGGSFDNYSDVLISFSGYNIVNISNTIFSNNFGTIYSPSYGVIINKSVFTENSISYSGIFYGFWDPIISNNNICHNEHNNYANNNAGVLIDGGTGSPYNLIHNCIFNNPGNDNKDKNIQLTTNQFYIRSYAPNYYGTTNEQKINEGIYDFGEDGSKPIIDISNKLNIPPKENHGLVWKVLVNGKDAQDEYDLSDPLGVGKQKYEVYFNKAMDVNNPPSVSMGVRYPYSQTAIAENGSWSADSTIYTVYKNVGLTTGDGINTIRVTGAKDMDHFETPIEDRRFRVVVSAANSSSLEFMASAGLGKVNLEWNNNKLSDGLGYNMYRMENINDSTLTQPILINKTLIADTLYTDFEVTPNKKYYYYYKIVRTDLSETDSSRFVSAIPFTASKGDANGDLSVNILDITTIVAWLLNNDPQPFIAEAADLNTDGNINVLDIVGVVNKILNVQQGAPRIAINQQVDLYMQNDTLFADATGDIGGIQLDLSGVSSTEDIQVLKALQGFESGYGVTAIGLRLLYYSMSGKSIPGVNRIPLLKMKTGSTISEAIFSETNGLPIKVNYILTRIGNISNNMNQTVAELGQNFPNPLNLQTTIPIRIYEPVEEAVLRIVNMMGQEVKIISLKYPSIGEHLLQWDAGLNKGLFVYTLEIKSGKQKLICPVKKMIVQ